ncbi:lanthionine synthetase LanC family protein [Aquimarina sp. W85]|uniref:lanthionine synthetase LanC family protein n=1 Tax=Aquimarina rhodophyticola TaxID=3342246 RepID=UPI0036703F86
MFEPSLKKIETILFESAKAMNIPTLHDDLGVLIFEATLYRYSKEEIYKQKALELFNTLIKVFGDRELGSGFLEGFEGIFYTVQYLQTCKIIEDESSLEGLEDYLIQSLQIDFKTNNFDPIHGSIGKLHYYINSKTQSSEKVNDLIHQFLTSLYENREETEQGIYWYDENEETKGLINLGLAHGLPGILAFLIRLKELKYEHQLLDILIDGIIKSLFNFKNNISRISNFPDYHTVDINQRNLNSRLGWCYGDLGITNTLLYATKILQREDLKEKTYKLLRTIIPRRIGNSGLDHFEDYSFLDTGFCHGLSGIAFMMQKINHKVDSPIIEKRIDFWKKELLKNLNTQLALEGDIYLPWYRQDKEKTYTLDKASILNGLCGTGLVLLSLHYNTFDWSEIFLLY